MSRPRYWQPYWWRLSFRADGEPGWTVLGPGGFSQVPNEALKNGSLEGWAEDLLAEARDELEDLRGDLLLECFPEPGAAPVCSREARLSGRR